MRKIIVMLMSLFAVSNLSAQSADEWLQGLRSSLGERYAMELFVEMGGVESVDDQLMGYFMVDGDGYYIKLGQMEVYSDGKLRYEVNNERKEVVEDRVNLESVDLLSNPTRAFSFLPDEFSASVLKSSSDSATLNLVPKSEDMGITAILLSLERRGSKVVPVAVSYDYDGDLVTITLTMLDTDGLKLRKWEKSAYRAYDIVSFL